MSAKAHICQLCDVYNREIHRSVKRNRCIARSLYGVGALRISASSAWIQIVALHFHARARPARRPAKKSRLRAAGVRDVGPIVKAREIGRLSFSNVFTFLRCRLLLGSKMISPKHSSTRFSIGRMAYWYHIRFACGRPFVQTSMILYFPNCAFKL